MQTFKTLPDAIALAEFAHRNQVDKAGLPYIDHPRRVLAKVQAQGAMPYVQIAAILHDVTEDTKFNTDMLSVLGFSEAALQIVDLLDRHQSARRFHEANEGRDVGGVTKGQPWYLALGIEAIDEFYYSSIKADPGALMVKLADIEDNLSPWRLSYLSQETQERLQAKYAKAKEALGAVV